ncbi:MAG: hypothetical protein ACOC92_01920 [bacterium]
MISKRPRLRLLFTLLLLASLAVGPAPVHGQAEDPPDEENGPPPRPNMSFADDGVSLSGLTPGGEAVLFGVAVRAMGFHNRVERYAEVLAADEEGEARLELSEELPPRAVWAVVDLPSGEIETSPTPGFPREAQPFPTAGLRGQGQGLDRFRHAVRGAHVLFVRPGEEAGAWGFIADDGSGYDLDGEQDGFVELSLEQLRPLEERPEEGGDEDAEDGAEEGSDPEDPPAEFLPDDLLVVNDPTELDLYALQVPPGLSE